jgi:hypothetical protein
LTVGVKSDSGRSMAGRIFIAIVGADLIAVRRTTQSLQGALDERFSSVRLVWSTRGSAGDLATVHALLEEHRVGDLFKLSADEVVRSDRAPQGGRAAPGARAVDRPRRRCSLRGIAADRV